MKILSYNEVLTHHCFIERTNSQVESSFNSSTTTSFSSYQHIGLRLLVLKVSLQVLVFYYYISKSAKIDEGIHKE